MALLEHHLVQAENLVWDAQNERFGPRDAFNGDARMWLSTVTGPSGSGKSTLLRTVAVLCGTPGENCSLRKTVEIVYAGTSGMQGVLANVKRACKVEVAEGATLREHLDILAWQTMVKGTCVLVLEQAQRLVAFGSDKLSSEIADLLIELLDTVKVSIILTGTNAVLQAVESTPRLKSYRGVDVRLTLH